MNLIQSIMSPQGGRFALLATLAALAFGSASAQAQYSQIGETGLTLAADTDGVEIYRIDLFNASTWSGNDVRLVSFLEGQYWMIDTPINLQFTGASTSLEGFGSNGFVGESLDFTTRGLLVPGTWSDNQFHYLGFTREVDNIDYYGVLGIRYNTDRSLTLERYGIMAGLMDIAAFEASVAVPEPPFLAAAFALFGLAGAAISRGRKHRAALAAV